YRNGVLRLENRMRRFAGRRGFGLPCDFIDAAASDSTQLMRDCVQQHHGRGRSWNQARKSLQENAQYRTQFECRGSRDVKLVKSGLSVSVALDLLLRSFVLGDIADDAHRGGRKFTSIAHDE